MNFLTLNLLIIQKSLFTLCFVWCTETVVVGILYEDMHKLMPDESQHFLDGYVLESIGINESSIICVSASFLSNKKILSNKQIIQ